tara:strand:- start:96 stop:236 length:141 start_codon:yes stop_codon:yes gene_type:complete
MAAVVVATAIATVAKVGQATATAASAVGDEETPAAERAAAAAEAAL